jgi:hypothetical protein
MAPLYSFDTSAFVQPHRRYYPFDVFPSFWRHLEKLIGDGSIIATEIVREELEQKDDELTEWAKNQTGLFVPVDQEQQLAVAAVVNHFPKWVDVDSSKNQGDPFVVALAMCGKLTVVSGEGNGSEIHPTIPFACGQMVPKVPHMSIVEFMRHTRLQL